MAPAAVASGNGAAIPLDKAAQLKLPTLVPRRRKDPNALPVPEAPPLPPLPDLSSLEPTVPTKRILSPHDHELFDKSATKSLILSFVFALSDSCRNKTISSVASAELSSTVKQVVSILQSIAQLVEKNPPEDQGASRFGNPAFRSFIDALTAALPDYHKRLNLPSEDWVPEISTYLENAFGSRQRIDYGSGHELNFLMWLLCLNRLGQLPASTFASVSLVVFPAYIKLLRTIQATYYLEPAGSHGVWGLDDYQFVPFLLGAAQLAGHAWITPRAIHSDVTLEEEADEYLYLDMIRWTVSTKTVKGLKWTQPMLDDISGARNWAKVEQGMRRMFDKEVLGKLPIMQHFLFGALIPAADGMGVDEDDDTGVHADGDGGEDTLAARFGEMGKHGPGPGHVHRDDTWGDCCGIKIPSTVAAGIEARKMGAGQALRRVPFD